MRASLIVVFNLLGGDNPPFPDKTDNPPFPDETDNPSSLSSLFPNAVVSAGILDPDIPHILWHCDGSRTGTSDTTIPILYRPNQTWPSGLRKAV
eukprot:15694201-Heterocapsa_arctica.AAC.1